MGFRVPLGWWIAATRDERDALAAAHPDLYIDATDLSAALAADTAATHQFDHDRYREELGMTERDYDDWTRGGG